MQGARAIRIGSNLVQFALLALAYGFGFYIAPIATGDQASSGYRYLLAVTAVLLLLAAHGFVWIRRSQLRRLDEREGAVKDVTTDVAMAVWEIFFAWIGVAAALVFLYYAAPIQGLADWYPRLFLCVVVFFGATYHRALIFVFTAWPFVFTINLLALWEATTAPASDGWAALVFLALDLALLVWAVRLARSRGVFASNELELPLGPGHVGGRLYGVIRSPQLCMPESGYQLDLSCIRQTREESGRSRGEILWHFRKLVQGDLPGAGSGGSSVPVLFDLPETALATAEASGARIAWTLRASAQLPDADFSCAFEAPVQERNWAARQGRQWSEANWPGAEEPLQNGVGRPAEDGSIAYRFRGRINRAGELAILSYCLFWLQLIWMATSQQLGWAAWAMLAVGIGFIGSLLWPWIGSYETRVGKDWIDILHRLPWAVHKERLPLRDVQSVEVVHDGWRAGLVDGTAFFRVEALLSNGRRVVLGAHLRERRLAERVAEEIEASVEMPRALREAG